MAEERIRVAPGVDLDPAELQWRFSASGGPGGQHANTANTAAEVRFDIEASASLSPAHRARLLGRVGPIVRVRATDERSQARNRDLALRRLVSTLAEALRVDPPRHATRPSARARRARLAEKAHRATRKAERRRPAPD